MPAMAKRYDAIIIGAGHNGLICSAYLAQAGLDVLVLERRHLVGGCSITEEVWPGYKVNVAAYLVSLMQERIVADLDLRRFGYEVVPKDPPFFSPFPDGRYLFFWRDLDKTVEEIAKFSRKDAGSYPRYEAYLTRVSEVIGAMLLEPPPALPPGNEALSDYLVRRGLAMGLSQREANGLARMFAQSAVDLLDEWFESDEVKVTLATDGVIGANGGPRSPGTAYILLHHCMGQVDGSQGLWGFVKGGMGTVPESIAASARSRGVEIRLEAPVRRIRVKDGRADGVILDNGDEIDSRMVISGADPHVTFLKLLDDNDLPQEFRDKIRRFDIEGTSFKMNLGLRALPEFKALPGAPGPQHRATMHLCPSVDYVEKAWHDCARGFPSTEPLLELTIPTMYDPSLAPQGRHIMGIFVQYAPYTLTTGHWDELREPFAEHILDIIATYAPNIREIIEHKMILSPLDLERRFAITRGNIFHGEMRLEQLFHRRPALEASQYDTPLPGLFLCGSGTHPGGGVMGAPGYNAAHRILRLDKKSPAA